MIYVNGIRLELQNHERYRVEKPLARRDFALFDRSELDQKRREYNPYGISKEMLRLYYWRPELSEKYDLKKKRM